MWDERKGIKDFFELQKMLRENQQIVLVGLSDAQIAKLPEGILGIKRTNSIEELAEIYSTADVFVNASQEETMGLTTVEALACGTPAVVYNATAVPEVVDETCGVVVEAGNVDELYNAINHIDFSSEACVRRAADFEKNMQYGKYYKLYKEIINS